MRRIVIAKALCVMVFSLYLAIAMSGALKLEGDAAHPMATAQKELLR
jgi:hypothetical protein